MKQNKYDDPGFFERYRAMGRSTGGLEEAGEWPSFRALLPDLTGMRVLDLGCGFGWHCRYAAGQGASEVVGVDISQKMLSQATRFTDDPRITYHRTAVEDLDVAGSVNQNPHHKCSRNIRIGKMNPAGPCSC